MFLNQVTFDYIKRLVAEEEQQNQSQKENQPPMENQNTAASGAAADPKSHDQCDQECDEDLAMYRDARLEEMLC